MGVQPMLGRTRASWRNLLATPDLYRPNAKPLPLPTACALLGGLAASEQPPMFPMCPASSVARGGDACLLWVAAGMVVCLCWWPPTWRREAWTSPLWTWWCTTTCRRTTRPSCTGAEALRLAAGQQGPSCTAAAHAQGAKAGMCVSGSIIMLRVCEAFFGSHEEADVHCKQG